METLKEKRDKLLVLRKGPASYDKTITVREDHIGTHQEFNHADGQDQIMHEDQWYLLAPSAKTKWKDLEVITSQFT